MTPDFKVIAAGVNITSQIGDRLLSLMVSDHAGFKSDTVEITLDDRDNAIELPLPGALLVVFMGYKETFLAPMGVFTADEVVAKGPPDRVTIRGKAVNLGGSIKEQKTRNWDNKTIEDIVATIAGEHGLEPKVAKELKPFLYEHLDQTDESDVNFLTRIAKDHDAISTVKGAALLFIGKGEGKTASGIPMIPRPITKSGELRWSMTLASRANFQAVEAHWHNEESGQKETVTAGKRSPVKRLRHLHSTKAEAVRAAKAKLDELKRGNDTLAITMPGDPTVAAEGQIIALGFRIGVSGLWSVTSARHQISGGGFTTSIQTEKPKE
ncbi:contractile injection system protein, VgrG/Pvc8 family [Cognatishimia sp. MH4019]|uniref:contractile injection system protein, VgrG/Pvc8 family n=1 Tax=Cognatishimia sp. MH4019 TaxID=2854030 RepID=UPI001CD77667|nr:contractile injection system protein, VgrG/Pvc8 family [Cognatishimia sp. MH4019]